MTTETHFHDGVAWRKAREIHFHDGTAWRRAYEIYVHDGSAWRKVFTGATPELPTGSPPGAGLYMDGTTSADTINAGFKFTTDGLIKKKVDNTYTDYQHWINPYPITGVGSGWYLRLQYVSGSSVVGLAYNTLYQLNTDRELWLYAGAEQDWSAYFTVQICDSGGTTIASANAMVEVHTNIY